MRLDYVPAPNEERPAPAAEPAPTRPAPLTPAAILQLQRTAGNHAVARILARQEAAPDAAAPDPAVIAFCKAVWPDDLSSQVRLVLEPTRLIPLVGLAGGGVADLIGAGQDLLSVPVGDILRGEIDAGKLTYGGFVGACVALRSTVNLANNAVGHLEMAPNVVVALGLTKTIADAATLVGAPLAVVDLAATAVPAGISEACGFIKIALTAGTTGLDLLVALEAAMGVLLFPDDAEEWWSLGCGYMANVGGDLLGMVNDMIGLGTAGASQPGAISQGLATAMGIAKTMLRTFGVFSSVFGMVWNVRGGDAVKEIPRPDGPVAEPPEDDLRSPAGAPPSSTLPLPRQALDGTGTSAAWSAARMTELAAMRDAVQRGEPIVRPVADQMGALVELAAASTEEAAVTQETIRELRAGVGALLTEFEGRLELVGGVEAQAAPALEQLTLASGQILAAIGIVENLDLAGDIELGDGAVVDAIEGAFEAGAGLLDGGLDAVKEAALVPLRELLEGLLALRTVVEAMIDSARIVLPFLQDTIAQLREVAAAAGDAPDQLQAMIDACIEFSTAGEITSFGEMMARWDQLGPEIDAATAHVAPQL
jgi:hypothetical protein